MSRIMVTGDTHRMLDIQKVLELGNNGNFTKDDYLIVCGDFGVIWKGFLKDGKLSLEDKDMIELYDDLPFTTLFVDGNHENHKALNKFEVTNWNGGKVHKLSDSLYHLTRGQVYSIDNVKFFTLGGARSTDRAWRTPDISWWEEELPNKAEYEEAITNLTENNFTVDYVLTHDCPTSCLKDVSIFPNVTDELENFLERLQTTFELQFKHWYFGHFHLDKPIDDKHTCLFDNIVTIKE